jgi:hypothetical protein
VVRRIDVKSRDVLELGGKLWVPGQLERRTRCGLRP